jgi:hypothetical protein
VKLSMYIAGSSAEAGTIRTYAERLEKTGLVHMTLPWWRTSPETWSGRDDRLTVQEQQRFASDCLEGIAQARCIWVLWPTRPSIGAYIELGAALERKRVIGTPYLVLTGAAPSQSVFCGLADYRDVVHELGFMEVLRYAEGRGRSAA